MRQIGHDRWKLENPIFNALSAHWTLDHCFHHDPVAIVNFLLTLFIAHIPVSCFFRLNLKEPLRRGLTLIALARQILMSIDSAPAHDIAWLHAPAGAPP